MNPKDQMPPLPPIERDEDMDRTYIPLPGGWEVQTKGKGSTFRIAHVPSERRYLVLADELHPVLEKVAMDFRTYAADLRARVVELEATPPGMTPYDKLRADYLAQCEQIAVLQSALAARQPVEAYMVDARVIARHYAAATLMKDQADWPGAVILHFSDNSHAEFAYEVLHTAMTAGMVSGAKYCQPVEAEPVWERVTSVGQVKVGDKLRFNIGSKQYQETARLILNEGARDEEVIYNKRKNFYFITRLLWGDGGNSNHKNVEVLRTAPPPSTVKGEVTDERDAFEAWFTANKFGGMRESMWAAWEARALLSQQGEQGGAA